MLSWTPKKSWKATKSYGLNGCICTGGTLFFIISLYHRFSPIFHFVGKEETLPHWKLNNLLFCVLTFSLFLIQKESSVKGAQGFKRPGTKTKGDSLTNFFTSVFSVYKKMSRDDLSWNFILSREVFQPEIVTWHLVFIVIYRYIHCYLISKSCLLFSFQKMKNWEMLKTRYNLSRFLVYGNIYNLIQSVNSIVKLSHNNLLMNFPSRIVFLNGTLFFFLIFIDLLCFSLSVDFCKKWIDVSKQSSVS